MPLHRYLGVSERCSIQAAPIDGCFLNLGRLKYSVQHSRPCKVPEVSTLEVK